MALLSEGPRFLRCLVTSAVVLCVLFLNMLPCEAQEVMDVTPAAELKRLRTDLLKNYDRLLRPVKNQSVITSVKIFFDVGHIVSLDEKYETLTVRGQLMMKWTDEFLTWDSSSYSGLTSVRFQPTEIWVPDIHSLYNTKAVDLFTREKGAPVLVYGNGTVKWYPPAVFDVPCSADYRHYPFDSHECSIVFGAWTHAGNDIILEAIDMESGTSSVGTAWRLRHVAHRNVQLAPTARVKFHMVRVEMQLERVSRMYRYICVLPTLTTLASSLFGFWLLPKEASRYLVGLSNVILTSLLLQYLAVTVPAGQDMPLLAQYSATCLCMSGIFILVTVFTHLLGERSGPVPSNLIRLTHRLSLDRYLCLLVCEDSALCDSTAPPTEAEKRRKDWARIALILDRIFFYGFCGVYVVLLGVLASI